ncbi:MAG: hypothetical protein JOZ64_03095 [Solirubrobacterales bacterium]|nr:hypothetical protein [Solirubrobacterales bacterium]
MDTELAAIGVRLFDDAYLAWFSAESESENALRAWWESTGSRRSTAYAAYRAALDREEAAARDLERLWSVSEPCRTKIEGCRSGEMTMILGRPSRHAAGPSASA